LEQRTETYKIQKEKVRGTAGLSIAEARPAKAAQRKVQKRTK